MLSAIFAKKYLDQIDILPSFCGNIARTAIAIFGFIIILGTIGIDVSSIWISLNLTSFAIGFALKDIIANAVAGLMILINQPFIKGNCIIVDTHEGIVKSIDLRYTTLKTEDSIILVPNSKIFTTVIIVKKEIKKKQEVVEKKSKFTKEEIYEVKDE